MKPQSSPPQYIKATGERTHVTSSQAMPDNRLLLTLDDGRSLLIDAERLTPQSDGTYHVKLNATTDHAAFSFVRTREQSPASRPGKKKAKSPKG